MEKNVAGQKFKVFAFTTATGVALTGDAAQITGKISIDGAALAAITDANPTELESGYYEFDATQAETNGKEILVIPISSTSGVSVVGVPALIKTDSPNMSDLGIESDGDLTKVNTCDVNTDMRGTDSAGTAAELAKVPKSDSNVTFNATALASINAECDTAISDAGLPEGIPKNAIFNNIEFLMVDSTDFATPETGLTVTGTRSIDGGAFAGVAGAIAEVGNGIYQFDAAAADLNGDVITFKFSSAGAADTFLTIKTSS